MEDFVDGSMKERSYHGVVLSLTRWDISEATGSGEIAKITKPVLIFNGENDIVVPMKDAELTA